MSCFRGLFTAETQSGPETTQRKAEIKGLLVNLDQGYLFNPFGKTKAARREVPLTEKACAVLARRLEKVKGDFVFPGRATDQPIIKVNRAHVGTLARINRIRSEVNESPIP